MPVDVTLTLAVSLSRMLRLALASMPSLAGLTVIGVDDDDATRKLLGLTLGGIGKATTTILEDPREAVAQVIEGGVDLLVCDAMMPEMSGLEVCRALAAHGGVTTPVVVLSAATAEELGWELPSGLRIGWLRKPFRPKELLEGLVKFRASLGLGAL